MPIKKSVKVKSLFDHINQIRVERNLDYFETLSDADKKTWSNYMVCRVLSMQPEFIDVVNDLQYYQDKLTPDQFYKVCISVTPKGKVFYPYIKSKAEKQNSQLLRLLSAHFQDSERNVSEYISILTKDDIVNIIQKYGYTEKQTKELLKA